MDDLLGVETKGCEIFEDFYGEVNMYENKFERENEKASVKVARVQCWENKKKV